MPFFGGNKSEKSKEKDKSEKAGASYPKQQVPPPPSHLAHPMRPQYAQGPAGMMVQQDHQQFVYQPAMNITSTSTVVHVSVQRNELLSQQQGFLDRLLDGPDFSNRVPDPRVPPAPGTYYVYSTSNVPPPLVPYPFQHGESSSSSAITPTAPNYTPNELPPPPSYDDVFSQEIKKKL